FLTNRRISFAVKNRQSPISYSFLRSFSFLWLISRKYAAMKMIYVFLLILITGKVYAQTANQSRLMVAVTNDRNDKLANATVELLKAGDSSLVKIMITDAQGQTNFEKLAFRDYLIRVSEVNHSLTYSDRISVQSGDVQ